MHEFDAAQVAGLLSGLGGVVALATCLFGYRLHHLFFGLIGALIGLVGGMAVGLLFETSLWVAFLIGVVLAVILALLAVRLHTIGIFLICFGTVGWAVYCYIPIAWLAVVLAMAGGVAAGVVGVKLQRPMVILSTGIGGGMSASQQLLAAFGMSNLGLVLGVGAGLSLIGVVFQWYTTKRAEKKSAEAHRGEQPAKPEKPAPVEPVPPEEPGPEKPISPEPAAPQGPTDQAERFNPPTGPDGRDVTPE